ncbi:MAG: SPFH domain-containing protein [Actinobacteria bacterium]|nr:SPFH domain-containing protein [Actinomycetota bacterium]
MSDPNQDDEFAGVPEPEPLGASASYAAEPNRRRRLRRGGGDGNGDDGGAIASRPAPQGSGRGPLRTIAVAAVVIVGLALVPLVAGALKKTPKDRIGISYGGGPIEGSHYQRVVQPGSSLFFNGFFDPLYLYPADQQNYIVSTVASEGAKPRPDAVVAPSKDRVQVSYQVAVYYRLNTDLLRPFHEQFGLKYQAYTPDGWKRLIEDTFRQQLENALQEETRRYVVADIYGDADLLLKIQSSVQNTLIERLELAMGKRYFCSPTFQSGRPCDPPTFVIKKVDLPKSVIAAFEGNRTSEIKIQTRTNEVEQRREEARGVALLNEALGTNGAVYALLKAIESGGVKFWVLPSDGGVTLNTPDGATGTTGGSGSTATPGG